MMITILRLAVCLILLTVLGGCARGLVNASSRSAGFDKAGDMQVRSRDIGKPAAPPELYVHRKTLNVRPKSTKSENGSLFNPADERNFLFTSRGPIVEGRYVDIEVASNRLDKKPPSKDKGKAAPAAAAAKGGKDELDASIAKALPSLEPSEADAVLLKRFKMKITHRFENGDVLAFMRRKSTLASEGSEISVQARIPYERIISGEPMSTNDLEEVEWVESQGGEIAERRSAGWEDEYTARLSGFNEARSKMAMDLEDKRKQLKDVKENLETRLKTFGSERQQMSKQREALLAQQRKDREQVDALRKLSEDQKKELDELKGEAADKKADDAKTAELVNPDVDTEAPAPPAPAKKASTPAPKTKK